MKYLFILLLSMSSAASAHCPNEVSHEGASFCMNVEWDYSEKKVQGVFKATDDMSPYLVPMGSIPPQWRFSKLNIFIWEKGDSTHTPVEINNLTVFPYMKMKMGHAHSTAYNFSNIVGSHYSLSEVRLQEMNGCWSLRWSTNPAIDTDSPQSVNQSSQTLIDISNYTNVTDDAAADIKDLCDSMNSGNDAGTGHNHNH